MLKRFLLFFVVVIVCSMSKTSFSQDLFLAFGQGAAVGTTSIGTAQVQTFPNVYLFARNGFNFDAIDVNVTSSNPGVATLSDSTIFNSGFFGATLTRFNEPVVDGLNPDGSVRFFGASFANIGIDSDLAGIDEGFDSVANAFLVGEIEFDLVSPGLTEFEISLGLNGILLSDGSIYTNPDFGSAFIIPSVPEPSSAAFLLLGFVGIANRRRR